MRAPRSTAVVLVLVALLVGVLAAADAPASAQDDGDEVAAIDIEVLRTGTGASVVPVRVTVVSRRAIEATIQLRSPNTNVSWELPVGLAANSEVEQFFVVPTNGRSSVALSAGLVVDGEEVADDEIDRIDAPTNAVGLVGLTSPGAEVQLNPDVGLASVIEMDDLAIVSALDTVVVSPAGLRSLRDTELEQLLQWTAAGRQLVVADDPGTIDAQLPSSWHAESPMVPAGTGFIRYVGVDWASNVPPAVSTAVNPQQLAGWFQSNASELLSDAGFRVPGLGAMALLLLVYLLLAGPVTFVVLSQMKRQTLAWVVVPALAVVFAVGVFGVGRFLSSGRGDGFATIIEVSPAGASVTDSVLIADDGRQTLELPDGWSLQSTGLSTANQEVGAPVVVVPTRTSIDLRFDIDQGSGGTAVLRGSDPTFDDAIVIADVSMEGSSVRGFIENSTDESLENVTALVGQRLMNVGSIESGARAEFVIDLSVERNGFAPELRTWDVDPRDNGFFGPVRREEDTAIESGPANGSVWLEWRAGRVGSSVPEAMITVVGWSRALDGSLVDGSGRTALVTHTALPPVDGAALPAHVRTLRVQVPGQDRFGNFEGFDAGGTSLVSQFVRPPGADTSQLALVVEGQFSEVEVWTDDGTWRSLELDDEGGRVALAVPEDLWMNDAMTVRYTISEFFGEPGQLDTRLSVRTDQTRAAVVLPPGERSRRNTDFFGPEPFEQEAQPGAVIDVELVDGETFSEIGELFGTYDVWRVELATGDEVRVRMDAQGGFTNGPELDPFLAVRDPDGNQIAENDDANGLNSALDFVAETPGTYEIETRPLGGSRSGGTYEVQIEMTRASGASE